MRYVPPMEDPFELMRRDLAELAGPPPVPVLGVVSPELEPRILAECERFNGELTKWVLWCGDPESAEGPFLSTTTAVGSTLTTSDAIEEERERLWNLTRTEDPPPGPSRTGTPFRMRIDGDPVPGELDRSDRLWAWRVDLGTVRGGSRLRAVVVGRGVGTESVSLGRLGDLTPYVEGRSTWLAGWTEPGPREAEDGDGETPMSPDDPAVLHRLADITLRSHATLVEELARSRRPPRQPLLEDGKGAALWEGSVRFVEARGLENPDARFAVAAAVNELVALEVGADWFRTGALRQTAITETLDYWGRGLPVSSGAAQRLWHEIWYVKMGSEPSGGSTQPPTAPPPEAERVGRLMAQWLAEWERWVESRTGGSSPPTT